MISLTPLRTIALLSAIGAGAGWSGQSSDSPRPGSIRWHADKAKQKGEGSITIQAPVGMYEYVTSLDQALSIYRVIIGTPIASVTQLVDSDHLYTWYKVKVIEDLITHPNPEVPAIPIPESLLPVRSDEVIIDVPEGTVTVDNIKVTVVDQEIQLLTLHRQYLFFLSPDSSGKFAYLRSGANAVFIVRGNNKIAPLVDRQTPMQVDVDASTGGSVEHLRSFAKSKASERLPAETEQARRDAIAAMLTNSSNRPEDGAEAARVRIDVFSDFQCPYCRKEFEAVEKLYLPQHRTEVKLTFHHDPLPIHGWAHRAAELAECAYEQQSKLFWATHDFLFENQASLTADNIDAKVFRELSSKFPEFRLRQYEVCVFPNHSNGWPAIDRDVRLAEALDVISTPTIFITGMKIEGTPPVEQLDTLVKEFERSVSLSKPGTAKGESK